MPSEAPSPKEVQDLIHDARRLDEESFYYSPATTASVIEGLCAALSSSQARIAELDADRARLDWLSMRVVEVRHPLPHGSRAMFFASPDDSFEGEDRPSDLRAKIDAALTQSHGDGQ